MRCVLIITHTLTSSDEDAVMQIKDNPYPQYLVGFSGYRNRPFVAALSLFVDISKRLGRASVVK